MRDREYFLIEGLTTYKKKFKALCREKEYKIEKYSDKLARVKVK